MDKNLPPQPPRGGSLTIDKKGNGYFESLTFHADGKIDRYREEFYKGERTKILQSTIEKPDSLKSRFVPIFEKSKEGKTENLKSQEAGFEKSQEGKIENLKEAGLKKSERSEFENEIYQSNDLSKSERSETSEIEKSGGQNEIER